MLIKNNKTKNKEIGSETTISQDLISREFMDIRNTDVQIPKARQGSGSNPGGKTFALSIDNTKIKE